MLFTFYFKENIVLVSRPVLSGLREINQHLYPLQQGVDKRENIHASPDSG